MRMNVDTARQHANRAGRGMLSATNDLLLALANGEVFDTYAGTPTSNVVPKAVGAWCLDSTNNIWYRAKGAANTDWVAIGTHGLTAAELAYLDGITAGTGAASKALVLDSNGDATFPGELSFGAQSLATEGGVGIAAICTFLHTSYQKVGSIIHTRILIDITGLNSNVVSDIIGDDGTGTAFICQITAAECGTILSGRMSCLETPATGEPDIDLFSAVEDSGVEDTLITDLDETAIVTAGEDWTSALAPKPLAAVPAADEYLYLVGGGDTTDATYSAGIFLIEFWGYDA